jgi:hypothetical protein
MGAARLAPVGLSRRFAVRRRRPAAGLKRPSMLHAVDEPSSLRRSRRAASRRAWWA